MFRTFRNFPRKKDPANVDIGPPEVNIFVIDGIADTSKSFWISPTRNEITDDGTLHIGLMNPFGAALTTIIQSGENCVPFKGGVESDPCQLTCQDCNCDAFATQLNGTLPSGTPPANQWSAVCRYTGDPTCSQNCLCGIDCVATRTTTGSPPFGGQSETQSGDCPSSRDTFNCSPNEPDPPDQVSQIIRAIERFIVDLDTTSIAGISYDEITSATLRLPIKRKIDWM